MTIKPVPWFYLEISAMQTFHCKPVDSPRCLQKVQEQQSLESKRCTNCDCSVCSRLWVAECKKCKFSWTTNCFFRWAEDDGCFHMKKSSAVVLQQQTRLLPSKILLEKAHKCRPQDSRVVDSIPLNMFPFKNKDILV